jgi:predicted secreted hydrolase
VSRRRFLVAPLALAVSSALARVPAGAKVEYPVIAGPRALVFPRDFGSHPEHRIEWWYITGWLKTERGEELGVQVTFFRARPEWASDNPSALAAKQIVFAHAAIADTRLGRLRHDQRGGRAGLGLAGAEEGDTCVWIDDWRLERVGDTYRARVVAADFAYTLEFTPRGPPILQGEAGYSRKGPRREQASHYYSRPHLAVTGTIERDGRTERVTGEAWLDHEWSSEILGGDAVGWDWAGLNLDDGGALMAFRIRNAAGVVRWAGGTRVAADGSVRTLSPEQVAFEPQRLWLSKRTGAAYPVAMRVRAGDERFALEPLIDDQELDSRLSVGTVYWEGAVSVRREGKLVGRGYLELTGYFTALKL